MLHQKKRMNEQIMNISKITGIFKTILDKVYSRINAFG